MSSLIDCFQNSIWLLILPFLESLSSNFSTLCLAMLGLPMLSKFADKSAQKFSIFSTKASFESSLMQQLHDIEGLDAIGPWPLAIGWWITLACGLLVLGIAIWFLWRRLSYLRSWKNDTFKKLDRLEQNLTPSTSGETIAILSEYLRRIALRRFPRKECAGLVGDAWLKWLKAHDPKQFDWTEKGKLLTEIPYAPAHSDLPLPQIKELIQAVRYWVC